MPHHCGRTHSRYDHRGDTASREGQAEAHTGNSPGAGAEPTEQEIAELAYSYWEARGRRGGSPAEDWLRAERELKARRRP